MKSVSNIKVGINVFLYKHCRNRIEQIQLMMYLVYSVSTIIGMPLHFALGLIGHKGIYLQAISVGMWLSSIVLFVLFLSGRLHLTKALFVLTFSYQFFECVRIVFLAAMTGPDWLEAHQKLLLINEILSYCNLVAVCISLVPKAPTVVFAMYTLSVGCAYAICPEVMLNQFVLLIFYAMVGIWLYSFVMQRMVRSTSREISDYKVFQEGVLGMFHMGKAEALSLIQLSREAGRVDGIDDKVLGNLSERTRHNLIALGEHLQNERRDKIVDLSTIFPQLSPTELDVARLILKNMTLKEIAVATEKSLSNVGTVRGNIRKKLGLSPGDDLRDFILARIKDRS